MSELEQKVIEIIKSKIFIELYNAEEKGLQQSQYCLIYSDIITKYGDKLSQTQILSKLTQISTLMAQEKKKCAYFQEKKIIFT